MSRKTTAVQSRSMGKATSAGLLLAAIGSYGLVLLSTSVSFGSGVAIRGGALAALGAALALYTNARLGPLEAGTRQGGRAQQAQRRYRTLALTSAGMLYLVLVAGTLMTDSGAIRNCLTVPICSPGEQLAAVAMGHRLLAALATLLIAALTWQTWRVRRERPLQLAAACALGFMLMGNIFGIGQVLLAQAESGAGEMVVRLTHAALGTAAWGSMVLLAVLALRPPALGMGDAAALETARPSLFKDYVSLTKPRVITLLIFTTLMAMFITPAGSPSIALVLWTMLGGWLMPAGAQALNCYFDRDIDVKMGRTARRPLPSNRIPAWHALVLGIALAAIAFTILALFVNLLTAMLALGGLFYYVVIYTLWLKRASPSNIVIGGGAGAIPPLVGWAAASGSLTPGSLLLFVIIFLWTPPHFWALALIRQKDYANAGVPMLPVVAGDDETRRQIVNYSIWMVASTLLLTPLGAMGLPYLLMAAALGAVFISDALRLRRSGTIPDAWRLYKFSLLYLAALFGAMAIDRLVFA